MKITPRKNIRKFILLVAILLIALTASFVISQHLVLVAIPSSLFCLFKEKFRKRPSVVALIHAVYSLELFASIYALTGSIRQAISCLCRERNPLSKLFRASLLMIRDGSDPLESLARIFRGYPLYRDWFASLINGSITDAQDIFSIWRNGAEEVLYKVDDLLSLVMILSTLIPIILTIMLMVFGVRPPWLFILVVFQLILFQGVYRWLGEQLSLFY
ncbi:MAG: hypothetical protein ACUVQ5_04665 [Candidatus Methanomethylicaceae archaeon]